MVIKDVCRNRDAAQKEYGQDGRTDANANRNAGK
jgi:hypothetical protein